jgi:hypothetical protein
MDDHPILGVALFVIGAVLVGFAYHSSNVLLPLLDLSEVIYNGQEVASLILGHVIMCNGVVLVVLGCRKVQLARR